VLWTCTVIHRAEGVLARMRSMLMRIRAPVQDDEIDDQFIHGVPSVDERRRAEDAVRQVMDDVPCEHPPKGEPQALGGWPEAATKLPDIDSSRVAATAAEIALSLGDRWELTDEELATLLGFRSPRALQRWRKRPPRSLRRDTLERISYLAHTYRSLIQIFGGPAGEKEWLRGVNTGIPFRGQSPLQYLLQGQVTHLIDTHRYLRRLF
jgi:hypothetical protein